MTPPPLPYYPWYAVVSGIELQQGDILEGCPTFAPIDRQGADNELDFIRTRRDVIVITHSCDLRNSKPPAVLLCDVIQRSAIPPTHKLSKRDNLELARKGQVPPFHVLAECDIQGHERELSIIDFRHVYSLPFDFVKREAERRLHLRLLPPYREHMSQAFAKFFMRIGLPADIPPIR